MNNNSKQSFWSKLLHSPLVRFFPWLIGAIASYIEFKQAGLTWFFWVLCFLTIIAALVPAVPLVLKWLREQKQRIETARLYYNHEQKVETLTELIDEFETLEKAKCFADAVKRNVRVVAILPVERRIGVILNIGRQENLQAGTRLLVHRIDHYTPDGEHIEQPLGLVQVTYVQAENNCSQAVVLDPRDREFWDQATTRLKWEKRIDPPKNFVVPYIPPELRGLSLEALTIIRQHLEAIRDSLTGQVVQKQEEGLQ